MCVRACVSVAALADCADGVSFVTSLNPAAHYLGLCPCTFLSAVGAVRSITSHGNLLQHADCSCTDRRVCVCVSERGVFVCVQSTPHLGELPSSDVSDCEVHHYHHQRIVCFAECQ